MKKKHILLIPHLLCVFVVVAVVYLASTGIGNMFINYMALSATSLFFLVLLPFASSISAVWLMIFVLKRKETVCKSLYIASGVIGAAVCVFYVAAILSTIFETDLAVFDLLDDIDALSLTFALLLVVINWVLWLVILVKTKKPFSLKYRKGNAAETDILTSNEKRSAVFTTVERYMILIPHIIWTLAVIAVTILTFVATGGDIVDFIKWLVLPFLVLLMFPMPTGISAVVIMIYTLARRKTESRKKFIACGILGGAILLLYALPFVAAVVTDGDIWAHIYGFVVYLPMIITVAIWVMWIIHFVKTKKTHKKVLGYEYEKE